MMADCKSPPANLNLRGISSSDGPFDLAGSYSFLPQTTEEKMSLIKDAWDQIKDDYIVGARNDF